MRQIIRIVLPAVVALVLGVVFAAAPPTPRAVTFVVYDGKVAPLADLIEKQGTKLDADAAPHWLALVCDDGKVYPLVKDGASRLFFLDKTLLNRPMRILGTPIAGGALLRVQSVQSVINGKAHEVYYWCDICSIRRGEKMICECCNDKMDLMEVPVKK